MMGGLCTCTGAGPLNKAQVAKCLLSTGSHAEQASNHSDRQGAALYIPLWADC